MIGVPSIDAGFAGKVTTVVVIAWLLRALITGKLNLPKWPHDNLGDDEDEIIDEPESTSTLHRTTE